MDIANILVQQCASFRSSPEYTPPEYGTDGVNTTVAAFAAYLWRTVVELPPGDELRNACGALEAAAEEAGDQAVTLLAPVFDTINKQRIAGHELEYDRLRQKLGEKTFGALQAWLEQQAPQVPDGSEEEWRKS